MDYFNFNGNSYILICDYFLKFPFLYKAKTSFWSLRDHLIDLFSIEGYPDEIVSDNGPPFNSKEFAKFLSSKGIKHTTSSPGYPRSNGFIERHIQMVKNMLSKSSNTRSFQEVLADLRTTRIGMGLPSPAEILHGRNLTTRAQAEIDINAICSVLQERQLKMTLDHDSSKRAKKARLLVLGKSCFILGPGNRWIDAFVTGANDNGRSYDVQIEATGGQLMRNRAHIRVRNPDIPMIHASYLQHNTVLSGMTSGGRELSKSENSVPKGSKQQLANAKSSSKMVFSEPLKKSIIQSTTSQVLVSETVPDRRVQPSRQAKKTRFEGNPVTSTVNIPPRRQPKRDTSTRNRRKFKLDVCDPDLLLPLKQTRVERHSTDLREPQPSPSDSHPASSQPVSETTTSESSVSLPSSPSGSSSTKSTSTSGTESSMSSASETSSESSSQPSSNASSPETTRSASSSCSTSPELLEMERSFNTLLAGTRENQGHAVMRSQMGNLREQQQRIAVLKQVASQLQNQQRPVSAPPTASVPLPPYPRRRPSDMGSRRQVQAENANAHKNSSDSETGDRLQDINEEPRRCIGPSRVKELAKYFTPTSDEDDKSRVNTRTRQKKLFDRKEEEEKK